MIPILASAVASSVLLGGENPPGLPATSNTSSRADCSVAVATGERREAMREFQAGASAIAAQEWIDAEQSLRRAVTLDPLLAVGHYGLGQTYMTLGRYEDAVAAFTASRRAFACATSGDDRARRRDEIQALREALRDAGDRRRSDAGDPWSELSDDARQPLDRVLSTHRAHVRLHELEASLRPSNREPSGVALALGTALFRAGALAEAEFEFRRAIARDPRSGDAHHNLALVYTLTDRLEEAEREIAAARKSGVPIHPRLVHELERRRSTK